MIGIMSDTGVAVAGNEPRWDFFVSYSAADSAWAEWIAWQLESEGHRVLVQVWDFVLGLTGRSACSRASLTPGIP